MNTVIPINNIIARLALRENLSESEATTFVEQFFGIIGDALENEGVISIKGFGTFTAMGGNVIFEPDDAFASKVNEPFEMFSPMVLDDNVDVSVFDAPNTPPPYSPPVVVEPTVEPTMQITDKSESASVSVEPSRHEAAPESQVPERPAAPEPANEASDGDENTIQNRQYDELFEDEPERTHGVSKCCVALWVVIAFIAGVAAGLCAAIYLLPLINK